jgi:ketosteroid isomerase-like protein
MEIVRRVYAAWERGDVPGPSELLDPDVEYVNPGGAIEPGTRRGLGEFTQALQTVFESYEYWRADMEKAEAIGDRVVVVVRYRLRGRGSGVEIEGRESALWTLRDGKVVRYEWFHGPDDAAAAVDG